MPSSMTVMGTAPLNIIPGQRKKYSMLEEIEAEENDRTYTAIKWNCCLSLQGFPSSNYQHLPETSQYLRK